MYVLAQCIEESVKQADPSNLQTKKGNKFEDPKQEAKYELAKHIIEWIQYAGT